MIVKVKLLIDYHAPVDKLHFRRLFAPPNADADAGDTTGDGANGACGASTSNPTLVGSSKALSIAANPHAVFMRRATTGVRLFDDSAEHLASSTLHSSTLSHGKGSANAFDDADALELLCKHICAVGSVPLRLGWWNGFGYREHVAARRKLQACGMPALQPDRIADLRTRSSSHSVSTVRSRRTGDGAQQADSDAPERSCSGSEVTRSDGPRPLRRLRTITQASKLASRLFASRPRCTTPVCVPANWTDLLLWAIIKGKHTLCRRLWEQTSEPLRAAIIASRSTALMEPDAP